MPAMRSIWPKPKRNATGLLVAVNSDESIQRFINPLRPVNPWSELARLWSHVPGQLRSRNGAGG